jgi:RNA polymerase sigma-70 factor, ECF subfamily
MMTVMASAPDGHDAPVFAAPARQAELDRVTLVRCRAQDPMAFRAFVVRYQRPVFALISRLCGRGAHVEDLAQEVFLKAYRAFPGFDPDGAGRPSTWLFTIATRTCLDARRSARVSAELTPLEEIHDQGTRGDTPESEHRRAQIARAIVKATAALADDQRAAFVLCECHGLSMQEMAGALGVNENTAKTRLFRARERLRELLGPLWEELHG